MPNITLSSEEIWKQAFYSFKRRINEQIDELIVSNERSKLKIILKVLAPTIYIYAVANEIDKWRSVILVMLALIYGIFKIGMLSLKFFRELLDVMVAAKEKRIKIEGIHYLYIIIFLSVVLFSLTLLIIYLMYSNDHK